MFAARPDEPMQLRHETPSPPRTTKKRRPTVTFRPETVPDQRSQGIGIAPPVFVWASKTLPPLDISALRPQQKDGDDASWNLRAHRRARAIRREVRKQEKQENNEDDDSV